MKISIALQVQKALTEEIKHLRSMEGEKAWSYRSYGSKDVPDAEWVANFDFEANHNKIQELTRLHTRLSQAISRTNLEVDVVGIEDADYANWA